AVRVVEDGPAGEFEIPVRSGRLPRRARVVRLVDLFETDVDVRRVIGVDGDDLVVPGLDAGPVAPIQLQRRTGGRQLLGVGNLVPRSRDAAAVRAIHTGQRGVGRVGVA